MEKEELYEQIKELQAKAEAFLLGPCDPWPLHDLHQPALHLDPRQATVPGNHLR